MATEVAVEEVLRLCFDYLRNYYFYYLGEEEEVEEDCDSYMMCWTRQGPMNRIQFHRGQWDYCVYLDNWSASHGPLLTFHALPNPRLFPRQSEEPCITSALVKEIAQAVCNKVKNYWASFGREQWCWRSRQVEEIKLDFGLCLFRSLLARTRFLLFSRSSVAFQDGPSAKVGFVLLLWWNEPIVYEMS